MTKSILRGVATIACLAVGTAFAQEPAQRPLLPAGSLIRVRLKTTLSDKTNKQGDPFTAMLYEPVTANGEEVIPAGSILNGHVAFVKESGRVKGVAELRLVADNIVLPDEEAHYNLSATLEDAQGADCQKVDSSSEEGTIKGCGKTAKGMAKNTAIGTGVGAAGGLMVGLINRGGCDYYYGCYPSSGPGVGASVLYGAGIGAGTALIYSIFKHNKHVILVQGAELTFVINRSVGADGQPVAAATDAAAPPPPAKSPPPETPKP
ncbi:MAG: hypothetical protein HY508_11620 [Acidobacteria bacterium]|nr:hypothetical protein [Acidobacteriota bacterium]